jgi:hypothetical protein
MDVSIVQNRSNRRLRASIGVAARHEQWLYFQKTRTALRHSVAFEMVPVGTMKYFVEGY